MNELAQRLAILKALGWKCCEPKPQCKTSPFARWAKGDLVLELRNAPDPLHDLNAMKEVLLTLSADQQNSFLQILSSTVATEQECDLDPMEVEWRFVTATAKQLGEVFLRTIGKWEES